MAEHFGDYKAYLLSAIPMPADHRQRFSDVLDTLEYAQAE